MPSELLPTDAEFDIILEALGFYKGRARELVMNEEVLKATQRISTRANKDVAERNGELFVEAFQPKAEDAILDFAKDLAKEIDTKAIQTRATKAGEDLTLLMAKVIKLRDRCRDADVQGNIDVLTK